MGRAVGEAGDDPPARRRGKGGAAAAFGAEVERFTAAPALPGCLVRQVHPRSLAAITGARPRRGRGPREHSLRRWCSGRERRVVGKQSGCGGRVQSPNRARGHVVANGTDLPGRCFLQPGADPGPRGCSGFNPPAGNATEWSYCAGLTRPMKWVTIRSRQATWSRLWAGSPV